MMQLEMFCVRLFPFWHGSQECAAWHSSRTLKPGATDRLMPFYKFRLGPSADVRGGAADWV